MADRDQNWILACGVADFIAKSTITGIGDVKVNATQNGLIFTNKSDGNQFEVLLPGFHLHSNMNVLNKLSSDTNGNILFDGKVILTKDNLIAGSGIKIKDNGNGTFTISTTGGSGSSGELGQDITSSIAVGGIQANTKFTQGTSYDDMWDALLNPYQKPIINTFTLNPNTATYEIGTVITSLVLNASITKKSKPLTFVKFYDGNTLLDNKTTGVTNGGNFSYTYSLNNDDTNMTFKVECSDGDNTVNKTTTVEFARNTFYGTDSTTNAPYTTSADIRALSGKKLKAKSGDTFTITIPVGAKKVVFAIPSTLNMTDVTYQEGLGASVKGVFTQSTINVEGANGYTGIDYKVYEYAPVSPFSAVCHYDVKL